MDYLFVRLIPEAMIDFMSCDSFMTKLRQNPNIES